MAHETSAEEMRAQAIEAMGPDAGPSTTFSGRNLPAYTQPGATLAALRAVLNHVETATLGSTTAFEAVVASSGGPRALIYRLQRGLEVENARRQRMPQKASQQT